MKIVVLILILAGVAYLAFRFLTGQKYKKSLFGTQKISERSSEIPLKGNVFANWWVVEHAVFISLRSKKNERNLLAAFILKWVLEGKMNVIPTTKKRRATMGLRLDEPFTDRTEMNFYEMLLAASGNDYVLESKEFERWAKHNYKLIDEYPRRADVRGKRYLIAKGYMGEDKKVVPAMYPQLCRSIEFKNYLKSLDLSLDQPKPNQWKDFLVIGALYGFTDKILKQLKEQLPTSFRDYARSLNMDPAQLLYNIEAAQLMASKGFTAAKDEQTREEQN